LLCSPPGPAVPAGLGACAAPRGLLHLYRSAAAHRRRRLIGGDHLHQRDSANPTPTWSAGRGVVPPMPVPGPHSWLERWSGVNSRLPCGAVGRQSFSSAFTPPGVAAPPDWMLAIPWPPAALARPLEQGTTVPNTLRRPLNKHVPGWGALVRRHRRRYGRRRFQIAAGPRDRPHTLTRPPTTSAALRHLPPGLPVSPADQPIATRCASATAGGPTRTAFNPRMLFSVPAPPAPTGPPLARRGTPRIRPSTTSRPGNQWQPVGPSTPQHARSCPPDQQSPTPRRRHRRR